jgi:hypothetical protein
MVDSKMLILGLAASVAVLSCGKKNSSSGDPIQDVVDQIQNALAVGYPDGLSVPSFPKSTTASSLDEADTKGETLAKKRDEAKKILEGTVEDCFANLKTRARQQLPDIDTCYEFDQEMIVGWRGDANKLYGTKNGLSNKTGSTEVCMVSFARDEMKEIEAMIDQALDRAQAMACLGKKASKTPPQNVGDVVDLKDDVNGKATLDPNAPVFSEVTLKRVDDKDGRPVFETKIVTTRGTQTDDITILHSPVSTTDNTSYNGVIKIKRTGGPSNDHNGLDKVQALSINYARANENGTKKIKASVRRGRFKSTYTSLFDADGRVDFSILPDQATNADVNGIGMVEFDMNQSDSTGSLSYWRNPGGSYSESARGFVFKVEKDTTGVLKGCSISGAAQDTSIRKSLKENVELKPTAWYHPFFYVGTGETMITDANYDHGVTRTNNGQTVSGRWNTPALSDSALAKKYVEDQRGSYVTRQCFKQDANGNYALDNGEISASAGYELIATNSPKFIAPPDLKAIRERKLK